MNEYESYIFLNPLPIIEIYNAEHTLQNKTKLTY